MKRFQQFINESELASLMAQIEAHKAKLAKMSPEKHIEKLSKTAQSIRNHVRAGGNTNQRRGQELADRYNDHYDAFKEHHPEAHKKWLKDNGFVPHNGQDMYA